MHNQMHLDQKHVLCLALVANKCVSCLKRQYECRRPPITMRPLTGKRHLISMRAAIIYACIFHTINRYKTIQRIHFHFVFMLSLVNI